MKTHTPLGELYTNSFNPNTKQTSQYSPCVHHSCTQDCVPTVPVTVQTQC